MSFCGIVREVEWMAVGDEHRPCEHGFLPKLASSRMVHLPIHAYVWGRRMEAGCRYDQQLQLQRPLKLTQARVLHLQCHFFQRHLDGGDTADAGSQSLEKQCYHPLMDGFQV
jgi:hypothetical protein